MAIGRPAAPPRAHTHRDKVSVSEFGLLSALPEDEVGGGAATGNGGKWTAAMMEEEEIH